MNCWKGIIIYLLQRNDETSISVNADESQKEKVYLVQAERLNIIKITNQQPRSEQDKAQRLFF